MPVEHADFPPPLGVVFLRESAKVQNKMTEFSFAETSWRNAMSVSE
jgi:hypothetical protein